MENNHDNGDDARFLSDAPPPPDYPRPLDSASTSGNERLRDSDRRLIKEAAAKAIKVDLARLLVGITAGLALNVYMRSGRGLRVLNYDKTKKWAPPIPLRPYGILGKFAFWAGGPTVGIFIVTTCTYNLPEQYSQAVLKKDPQAYARIFRAINRIDAEFRFPDPKRPVSAERQLRTLRAISFM